MREYCLRCFPPHAHHLHSSIPSVAHAPKDRRDGAGAHKARALSESERGKKVGGKRARRLQNVDAEDLPTPVSHASVTLCILMRSGSVRSTLRGRSSFPNYHGKTTRRIKCILPNPVVEPRCTSAAVRPATYDTVSFPPRTLPDAPQAALGSPNSNRVAGSVAVSVPARGSYPDGPDVLVSFTFTAVTPRSSTSSAVLRGASLSRSNVFGQSRAEQLTQANLHAPCFAPARP